MSLLRTSQRNWAKVCRWDGHTYIFWCPVSSKIIKIGCFSWTDSNKGGPKGNFFEISVYSRNLPRLFFNQPIFHTNCTDWLHGAQCTAMDCCNQIDRLQSTAPTTLCTC